MLQRALSGSGGGGTPTYEIDEKNCYSTAQTYTCTNAFFTVGCKGTDTGNQYVQEGVGYVDNGTLYMPVNLYGRVNASYSNGVLSIQGGYSSDRGWVKIGYM